ncbi:hypothetical protein LUD75_13505 [Epilithonimonas sp. JDS]|uniref:hypothetical protein n=1 Tax=Epilithonimonas sp. JDS TaxID=2902797 RepID=UPI001E398CAF|nr:hypothetical protein [Epilithonimonas sp. JDS]MCD9855734.1 hypothetical protein [Epilithonimonas sp. JDS]
MPDWFEELPELCPPKDVKEPAGETYYRLVSDLDNPIAELVSQRTEFPTAVFKIDECICRAVSLYLDKKDCEDIIKFPRHKNKSIYSFKVDKDDGLIKKTFKGSHHSWWRSHSFTLANE